MLALVLTIAAWVHPGAEISHRAFLEAVAIASPSEAIAAEIIVFAEHESRFGDALTGPRWDHQASGILQIRGWPSLETDELASVGEWLRIRARAEAACGPELALAGLASGDCHRGTRLASARAAEARWYLMMARAVGEN